ncbi:MAG: hypothetical protein ACI8QZ_002814 [Chlamydiales bacterium]|jgi:hypothetical protein
MSFLPCRHSVCSVWIALAPCLASAAAPQDSIPFTEEAAVRGVDHLFGSTVDGFGSGIAFADLDMDGDPDIVAVGHILGYIGVFENDGMGHFTARSDGIEGNAFPYSIGISVADYDADGDLDLFITVKDAPCVLLRNDGDFQFVDVASEAGVDHSGPAQGSTWGDYNGDGWPDLYVTIRKEFGGGNLFYRNRGDGTFEEIAAMLGIDMATEGMSFHATFVDYNHDRLPDLYLCSDKGQFCTEMRNHLWENQGQTFVEVTDASGTEACVACMGIAVGDLDANGHTDFYCTNLPYGNVLLLNQGDKTFVDATQMAGVGSYLTGWGTIFLDYDNDADLDLYVCNDGPNRIYENKQVYPLVDVAPQIGLATENLSSCVAAADVDNDGDLDLLVEGRLTQLLLFINHEDDNHNWLQVKLFGNDANTQAIGARVVVQTGASTQYREIHAGIGFKSSNSLVASFGLGDATIVERVSVEWRSGNTTTLTNVAVNQRLIINKGTFPPLPRGPLPTPPP